MLTKGITLLRWGKSSLRATIIPKCGAYCNQVGSCFFENDEDQAETVDCLRYKRMNTDYFWYKIKDIYATNNWSHIISNYQIIVFDDVGFFNEVFKDMPLYQQIFPIEALKSSHKSKLIAQITPIIWKNHLKLSGTN